MPALRVHLVTRRDDRSLPGGDSVQVRQTARELRRQGCAVTIGDGVTPPPDTPDLVHIFNATRLYDSYSAARWCTARGIPYVFTPIWHALADLRRYYRWRYGTRRFPLIAYLGLKELYHNRDRIRDPRLPTVAFRWRSCARWVFDHAALLAPNSPSEANTYTDELGLVPRATQVIPYAVSLGDRYPRQERRVVIVAGRVEPRKNTLGVIQAFRSSPALGGHALWVIGAPNPRHRAYVRAVRAATDGRRIHWFGALPHDALQSRFAQAKGVVLASFFETAGLVGLEGLYQGANAVITRYTNADFYYGDHVIYCDPYDAASLQAGLERVVREPPRYPEAWFQSFSWAAVGETTRASYHRVVRA